MVGERKRGKQTKREIEVLYAEEKEKMKKTEHKQTNKEKDLQEWKRRGLPKNKVDHRTWSVPSDKKKREFGEAQEGEE